MCIRDRTINGINFANFIAPGLIMMTMLQNSFANGASSIGQSKFQGNIVDILMAPLNNFELTAGYICGSIIRGLICGLVTYICIIFFISIIFSNGLEGVSTQIIFVFSFR